MKKTAAIFTTLLLLISVGCSSPTMGNIAYVNAVIYTCDTTQKYVQCMVVDKNGKILYTGDEEAGKPYMGSECKRMDMQGRLILPGFTDSHMHPFAGALFDNSMYLLDITWDFNRVKEEVKRIYALYPDKDVYIFQRYSVRDIKAHPTAADLDLLIKDKPLVLIDDGFHNAIANTKALEVAGITATTPDPQPGSQYFTRDKAGNPTGGLIELFAIAQVMGKLDAVSAEGLENWMYKFAKQLNAMGFTSLFDAGDIYVNYDNCTKALINLAAQKKLSLNFSRSYIGSSAMPVDSIISQIEHTAAQMDKFDNLRMNTLKLYLDGTVEANTSPMIEPLASMKGYSSNVLIDSLYLQELVHTALAKKYHVHIHAIGDKAVEAALNVYTNNNNTLHTTKTICHNEVYPKGGIEKIKGLNNFFFQTTPAWCEENDFTTEVLGEDRMQRFYPTHSAMKAGAIVTFGSDYPASTFQDINPFVQMYTAVIRGTSGQMFGPATEKIDIESAVMAYTLNGAKQLGIDAFTGSLEPGKFADFMVLDRNIMTVPVDSIEGAKVLSLYYRGDKVYNKE